MYKSTAAAYSSWRGCERLKWALRAPVKGRHQEVKWADGLLHTDGAVTHSWFNDPGARSPCALSGRPLGTAVFGWEGGAVSSGRHFTLPCNQGCHRGSGVRHGRGSCRMGLLKLIRHATPAWPPMGSAVCVCLPVGSVEISSHERADVNTCLLCVVHVERRESQDKPGLI